MKLNCDIAIFGAGPSALFLLNQLNQKQKIFILDRKKVMVIF